MSSKSSQAEVCQIQKARERQDIGYYKSYSSTIIHRLMIKDKVRTETYRDSMYKNRHLFEGKIVLDVGAGSGILSMFAAKAGAARVIAVECSDFAEIAKRVIEDNKLDHIITVLKEKVEEITALPDGIDEVDIIVSEWMGVSLFNEAMLDSVIFARDKWLNKENGIMFPDQCSMFIAGINDEKSVERVNTNQLKYDLDLSTFYSHFYSEDFVATVRNDKVLTSSYQLKQFDLHTVKVEDTSFECKFRLLTRQTGTVHGFAVFFAVEFTKCKPTLGFSTSPSQPRTHWEQTVCYLNQPMHGVRVTKGEEIFGKFQFERRDKCNRTYRTTIHAVFADDAANHCALEIV